MAIESMNPQADALASASPRPRRAISRSNAREGRRSGPPTPTTPILLPASPIDPLALPMAADASQTERLAYGRRCFTSLALSVAAVAAVAEGRGKEVIGSPRGSGLLSTKKNG